MKLQFLLFIVSFCSLCSSCTKHETEAINYGKDECAYCLMDISDNKFGSEIISNTGKVFKFDSPECMASIIVEGEKLKEADVHSYWVTDFVHPGEFIDARSARYLESSFIHSPMGMNYAAFTSQAAIDAAITSYPGQVRGFNDVMEYARREQKNLTMSDKPASVSSDECDNDSCACSHRRGEACKCTHGVGKRDNCPCKHDAAGKCPCKHRH